MKIIHALTILIFILWGCKGDITEPVTLAPYELWHSYSIHNYKIEQIRNCYCINSGEKMEVTVISDTVSSVERISDSAVISYQASRQYLTIDSLFRIIQNPKIDSLIVIYDPQYGYPIKLDIDPQLHPVDGGVLYLTSNLQIFNDGFSKYNSHKKF
jgi:hypothetical protein